MPSLCSILPTEKPGVPFSTIKPVRPRCRSDLSTVAKTTMMSASAPLVIKILLPLSLYPPLCLVAVISKAATSLPAPGSVRAKQASFSPLATGTTKRCLCSSLPNRYKGKPASPALTMRIMPTAAETRHSSSAIITSSILPPPPPPYLSGKPVPASPSSIIFLTCSAGKRASSSIRAATGSISFSAKFRTIAFSIFCSSVSEKSMPAFLLIEILPGNC